MPVGVDREAELGADAVGCGDEEGILEACGPWIEDAAEAADFRARRDALIAAARGEAGQPGAEGTQGQPGPAPRHQWQGTRLRFQNPDNSWGEWVELRGDPGKTRGSGGGGRGSGGGGGGSSLNFEPNTDGNGFVIYEKVQTLSLNDSSVKPRTIIRKDNKIIMQYTVGSSPALLGYDLTDDNILNLNGLIPGIKAKYDELKGTSTSTSSATPVAAGGESRKK
jgi:hypothetical protein